jgi:hypothetical protein
MAEKSEPRDYEEIDRLVRNEIDQALEIFRAGDFEARVRRRLAAEKKPGRRRRPLLVRITVPAAAVLITIVAAALTFLILRPGRAPLPVPIDAGPIAAVLGELTHFSDPAVDLTAGPAGEQTPSGMGDTIARVLGASGAGADLQAGPGPDRLDILKGPPLTMKKRMEILFKDKVIERVLMSWAAKAKEV